MGLVCDLGINQAIPKEPSTMQAFKCAVGWKQPMATMRTIEERRAALGCFLITSWYLIPNFLAPIGSKINFKSQCRFNNV